jgi:hypothetical protein
VSRWVEVQYLPFRAAITADRQSRRRVSAAG